MNTIDLQFIKNTDLTEEQKKGKDILNGECFADVSQQDIEEDFIVESFANILAYKNNNLIGKISLIKRKIKFDGKDVYLGGIGGVCVTASERRQGIALKMIQKGLEVLKHEGCDVVCLNTDTNKSEYKLYEASGFKRMDRKISFENVHGKIKYDYGTYFYPLCSKDLYDFIMNSNETFHYGRGYW